MSFSKKSLALHEIIVGPGVPDKNRAVNAPKTCPPFPEGTTVASFRHSATKPCETLRN